MLRNYILIAWRTLLKNKVFSLINILGLAIGLTCCLLIALWVKDELSYDRFHQNASEIYRTTIKIEWETDVLNMAGTPLPLAGQLEANYPEVKRSVRYEEQNKQLVEYGSKKLYVDTMLFADPAFLELFSFPSLYGNTGTALANPESVVITRKLAEKLFASADQAVGKTILFKNGIPRTVTAVLADIPATSHLQFEVVVPLSSNVRYKENENSWSSYNWVTYIQVPKGYNIKNLEAKMGSFYKKVIAQAMNDDGKKKFEYIISYQPLTDIHLHSGHLRGHEGGITMAYIYSFGGIAFFILLIACINYMNLATARSLKRAKEVGIRKVVGSSRSQLIGQYLAESLLLTLLSLVISLTLLQVCLPVFNYITGKEISASGIMNLPSIGLLLAVVLITGLVSGSYPAFILSGFKPVMVLKGGLKSDFRGVWVRKGLVIFQFSISIMMLIGTHVVYSQLQFMKNTNLGFSQEQVLTIPMESEALREKAGLFKQKLLAQTDITGVAFATYPIGESRTDNSTFKFEVNGKTIQLNLENYDIDYDYLPVLQIDVKEGRNFAVGMSTDTSGILINESLRRRLGVKQAVGLEVVSQDKKYRVIGVFEDFHLKSLHNRIEPLAVRLNPERGEYMYLKVNTANVASVKSAVEKVYRQLETEYPFEIDFLDQTFARQYKEDERKGNLFLSFAAITIFIACLGLFGLATYSIEQRTKEIGIRKVLGASEVSIVNQLSKDFLKLVLIANLVAWPLAWYLMRQWLQDFAYHMDLTAGTFIGAGVVAIVVAFGTVSFQTIKAALANPVKSLKQE